MHKQLLLIIGGMLFTTSSMTPAITHDTQKLPLFMITRKKTNWSEKDKQEVREILASFAAIMQCFFTIVQDPENRQNVTVGIGGILANIAYAGKVIMRGSDILLDQDKEILEEWLDTMPAPAQRMCYIFTTKHK